VCAEYDAALFVVTHYNRKEGRGPARFTGTGPAEWGRVLIGAAVLSRNTDPDTKATTVLVELDVIGGEVPDQTYRLRRHIVADDPDDLDSPLHYTVTVLGDDAPAEATGSDVPPAAARVLAIVQAATEPLSVRIIGDRLAEQGHPLKARTIQKALGEQLAGRVDTLGPVDHHGTHLWLASEATS
jgi:hypothetical protein